MWTRRELKENAKNILRTSYWRALLISFIIVIAGGSLVSNSSSSGISSQRFKNTFGTRVQRVQQRILNNSRIKSRDISIPFFNDGFLSLDIPVSDAFEDIGGWPYKSFVGNMPGLLPLLLIGIVGFLSLIFVILAISFRVLVGYNLEIGGKRYFLLAAQGDEKISNAFNNIKSRYYVNIVFTMLLRDLYNALWFCLFFFPGIVKSYAYSMVPYILAENPDMPPTEAISLSCRMTNGHKMSMFILDISFIGWYLLSSLAFGIGRFFVNPYVESTYAQLYLTLSGGDRHIDTREEYIDVRPVN